MPPPTLKAGKHSLSKSTLGISMSAKASSQLPRSTASVRRRGATEIVQPSEDLPPQRWAKQPHHETDDDRMSKLEGLISKRKANFEYMRKVHAGNTHWMNAVLLTRADIAEAYHRSPRSRLAMRWASLGLSMGKLLALPISGGLLVRAVAQMLLEFDYHYANAAKQSVKFLLARQSGHFPDTLQRVGEAEPVDPRLHRNGHWPVYEHLMVPDDVYAGPALLTGEGTGGGASSSHHHHSNTSFHVHVDERHLDMFEIVLSLSAVLSQLYSKLLDPSCANAQIYDAVLRLDEEIKHHVLNAYSKALNNFAVEVLRGEMHNLALWETDGVGGGQDELVAMYGPVDRSKPAETVDEILERKARAKEAAKGNREATNY